MISPKPFHFWVWSDQDMTNDLGESVTWGYLESYITMVWSSNIWNLPSFIILYMGDIWVMQQCTNCCWSNSIISCRIATVLSSILQGWVTHWKLLPIFGFLNRLSVSCIFQVFLNQTFTETVRWKCWGNLSVRVTGAIFFPYMGVS